MVVLTSIKTSSIAKTDKQTFFTMFKVQLIISIHFFQENDFIIFHMFHETFLIFFEYGT